MDFLTETQKKLLRFQCLIFVITALGIIFQNGILGAVVLTVLTFSILPIEKLKNPVIVFLLAYFITLIGIEAFRILYAVWV